jgi:Uma2 family endonuclease
MIAALRPIPEEQFVRVPCVPWEAYVAFCDALGERHIRVTYDQGEMEVMTLSSRHENQKCRLRRLVEFMTIDFEIEMVSAGSMTCRNEEMLRALEPDECYWIANAPLIRDRDDIDLDVDPPPDLALEFEISRSSLDRLSIYAVLKVPEIWRWDGSTLTVHILSPRGTYRVSKRSKAFPFLPLDEFSSFLKRPGVGELELTLSFRDWLRENRAKWKK